MSVSGVVGAERPLIDPFADASERERAAKHFLNVALAPRHALRFAAEAELLSETERVAVASVCRVLGLHTRWDAPTKTLAATLGGSTVLTLDTREQGRWWQIADDNTIRASFKDATAHLPMDGAFVQLPVVAELLGDLEAPAGRNDVLRRRSTNEEIRFVPLEIGWVGPGVGATPQAFPCLLLGTRLWVHSNVLREAAGVAAETDASRTHVLLSDTRAAEEPQYQLKVCFQTYLHPKDGRLYVPARVAADALETPLSVEVNGRRYAAAVPGQDNGSPAPMVLPGEIQGGTAYVPLREAARLAGKESELRVIRPTAPDQPTVVKLGDVPISFLEPTQGLPFYPERALGGDGGYWDGGGRWIRTLWCPSIFCRIRHW